MASERLPAGELLTEGAPSVPRLAATVVVLRDGAEGLEVLLVQRNPRARFMGGLWVFPGGAVDRHEGDDEHAHRVAGVREVEEEVGVRLDGPEALVPTSRWITPERLKVRFDTRFYLAAMPEGQAAVPDGWECVRAAWPRPRAALDAHAAGEMAMVLPTLHHLRGLATAATVAEALDAARERPYETFVPRVVGEGEQARVEVADAALDD